MNLCPPSSAIIVQFIFIVMQPSLRKAALRIALHMSVSLSVILSVCLVRLCNSKT